MVALLDPGQLQGVFSTLIGMLDRVGLNKKVWNTIGIVCRLCQVAGTQAEAAYKQWMTGAWPLYRERQYVRVQCMECRAEMAIGSLEFHLQTHQGKATFKRIHWGIRAPGREPCT